MSEMGHGMIAIRGPTDWWFALRWSFIVRVDGRRAGKLKPGVTAECKVGPGSHVVDVSNSWIIRSRPLQVAVKPAGKFVLKMRSLPNNRGLLKFVSGIFLGGSIPRLFTDPLLTLMGLSDSSVWTSTGLALILSLLILAGYVLVTSILFDSYWVWFALDADETT